MPALLKDHARQSLLWLIVLLVLLMFTGMWVLSSLNLNFSEKTLSGLRSEQIKDNFQAGLARIEHRQNALQSYNTTLAQVGESFWRLTQTSNEPIAKTRLRDQLDHTVKAHLQGFEGASGGYLWFKSDLAAYFGALGYHLDNGHVGAPLSADKDYQQEGWFRHLSEQLGNSPPIPGKVYWTPAYFDVVEQQAKLALISPMFDIENNLIGYATTDWAADTIIEMVSQTHVTHSGFAFLLDQNNRSLSSLNLNEDTLLAQELIDAILALDLPNDPTLRAQPEPNTDEVHIANRDWLLWFDSTPAGMVFGVGAPQDEIDAVLLPMRDTNQHILIVTGLILMGISFWLLRRMLKLLAALNAAYTDSLTHLPNRPKLLIDIASSDRVELVLINIDRFKEINSLFGQSCGDSVLIAVADKLQRIAQPMEMQLYRLPGDEFALIFPILPATEREQLASNLHEQLQGLTVNWQGQLLTLHFTFGIASQDDKRHTPNDDRLLTYASIALREARSASRNYGFYDPADSQEAVYEQNMRLSRQLRDALTADRIIPWFQPIYDNVTGRINKYECLIRLVDQTDNIVSPGQFLELAHQLRLSRELTRRMIEKCFATFRDTDFTFSINLSCADVQEPGLVDFLTDTLRETGLGKQVIFEILESDGIANYHDVIQFIHRVKAFGCQIAIDDFGTGYSNFAHLQRLNVDIIKIDGSLIRHIHEDPTARQVTEGIVEFAKRLNMKTVAEFVHCKAVQEEVLAMNIDFSQGAFFGMPSSQLTGRS
ncbi:diguanylate cyclase/phosphodiesterase (GGDEF & EAL domains) with PAS/PAC sensor(s) [Methylophaga frappieri]|uniref:Diguanylate cyclase/phosphodiesterase (GGDEF & EAL domains) with PAS/PAC sensor(S) n=1 Tax=Methylophaga frappieri (strain ATCC BAA-2434 / DSM 25690 / JAM7) TaxID=754477 RepID=I1YIJ4_METFJ|nr:EAL domain-containing protein [Methylophaga frappieri]AFJ02737.1 diguanylate cyclase/phosphodiesterase (GGDEF & EAL domains) with PAS/PAC sensor(s) [Methylophaga frappieri]